MELVKHTLYKKKYLEHSKQENVKVMLVFRVSIIYLHGESYMYYTLL